MQEIKATYRIVTPMFLGGANQQPDDDIRPPSVKGALRFWWRALNWGKFRNTASCDETALILLHNEEARLFGIAANDDEGGGQGCFLLRVQHEKLTSTAKDQVHPRLKPTRQVQRNGRREIDQNHLGAARYLGYGLMVAFGKADGTKHSGQLERGCLNENQEFTVKLVFRNAIEPSVRESLIAWGLVGGLGSRSRHGMGSVALISLEENNGTKKWTAPENTDDYDSKIKALFSGPPLPNIEAPFSAFWEGSRIDRLLSGIDRFEVLNDFGSAMLMYRSWGRSSPGGGSTVLGSPSEQRFKDDHDWFKGIAGAAANPNFHPERVVFGLPHNYHQTHHHVTSVEHERRSSPLLFHVHPVGDQFVGISVYLPAQFLPNGEKIKANGRPVPAVIDWSIITCFLDGKVGKTTLPGAADRFPSPGKMAVLP